jgi:hypothetical protein
MADRLTPVVFTDSWQDYTIAQRIYDAYVRRFAASTLSVSDTPTAFPSPSTVFHFIEHMQAAVQTLSSSQWLDPTASVELTSKTDLDNFSYLSTDAFLDSAGLDGVTSTTRHWRRIAEGGTPPSTLAYDDAAFSYGPIQSKDMAGPWLFDDLQTALLGMFRRRGLFADGTGKTAQFTIDETGTPDPYTYVPTAWASISDVGGGTGADVVRDGSGSKSNPSGINKIQSLLSSYAITANIFFHDDTTDKLCHIYRYSPLVSPDGFHRDTDVTILSGAGTPYIGTTFTAPFTTGFTSLLPIGTLSTNTPSPGTYAESDAFYKTLIVDYQFDDGPV